MLPTVFCTKEGNGLQGGIRTTAGGAVARLPDVYRYGPADHPQRTGFARTPGTATFFRIKAEPLQGWGWRKESKLSPSTDPSPSPADIQQATLVLLCLAEAAGQLVIVNTRAVWELMNQPLPRPARERTVNGASLCEHSAQRLDTS
jgi:hypothetical protein